MKKLLTAVLLHSAVLLVLLNPTVAVAGEAPSREELQRCAAIADNQERLACYDALARPAAPAAASAAAVSPAQKVATTTPPADKPAIIDSYLVKRWDLDESKPRGRFTLIPHRDNYILPVSYNDAQYQPPANTDYPVDKPDNLEVKYQISLKSKLWQDVLGQKMDLWFAYTQQSYWQLYNVNESAPFRETNYEPELLLNLRPDLEAYGFKLRTVTFGLNHQSNGRSEPLSRSWNRIVGSVGIERGPFTLLAKGWYRIPESRRDDDNRDINRYMGPGELQGYFRWGSQRLGVTLRNNCRFHDNHGAVLVDWSMPLLEKVGLYVQYFNGYGENLLDYDRYANRIGVGFILSDWN